MSNDIQRNKGTARNYKFDRGGMPTEHGPFIGVVKNNFDPTRSGRLQVYIEQFGGNNPADTSLWRTVSYISPYYGVTPVNNASSTETTGSYKGNPQSYGMWFTAPDVNTKVICFFVGGDPNQGYYTGCVVEPGVTQMIPAIGASSQFVQNNSAQGELISGAGATMIPVVEVNNNNLDSNDDPQFFNIDKPAHGYTVAILANQGLLADPIRGSISSSASRESPSTVFGFSTPGRPIYQGGITDPEIPAAANSNDTVTKLNIEGRRGGHTLVMDDGDPIGSNNLIRIRTGKGHQITLSDDGDCLYITHSNGQTWMELGSEGTVDVFATNSINLRSKGDINLHADRDISLNGAEGIKIRGVAGVAVESDTAISMMSKESITAYAKKTIGMSSGSTLVMKSKTGGFGMSGALNLKGSKVLLNSGSGPGSVEEVKPLTLNKWDDVLFDGTSFKPVEGDVESIVTRITTHEPYPYHNEGVDVESSIESPVFNPSPAETSSAVNETVEQGPVTNRVNESSILGAPIGDIQIGNLQSIEISSLLAEKAQRVNQSYYTQSIEQGVGKFGLQPAQLESLNFLKPGTTASLTNAAVTITAADISYAALSNYGLTPAEVALGRLIENTLKNPGVWTGKDGVLDVNGFLQDSQIQNASQQMLYKNAFEGLSRQGIINGNESSNDIVGLISSAGDYGVNSVGNFVTNVSDGWSSAPNSQAANASNTSINTAISGVISNSSFAGALGGLIGSAGGGSAIGAFFSRSFSSVTDTVSRSNINNAVINSLNDVKITPPNFSPLKTTPIINRSWDPVIETQAADISAATTGVATASTQADRLLTDATNLSNSATISQSSIDAISSQVNALTNTVSALNVNQQVINAKASPGNLSIDQAAATTNLVNQDRLLQTKLTAVRSVLIRSQRKTCG